MRKSTEDKVGLALKVMAVIPDGWSPLDVLSVAELFTARVVVDMELEPHVERMLIASVSENICSLVNQLNKIKILTLAMREYKYKGWDATGQKGWDSVSSTLTEQTGDRLA